MCFAYTLSGIFKTIHELCNIYCTSTLYYSIFTSELSLRQALLIFPTFQITNNKLYMKFIKTFTAYEHLSSTYRLQIDVYCTSDKLASLMQ